jgi:hypothetical protein
MELARVLAESGIEFDATLVFALWAGEEQGMFGSRPTRSGCVKQTCRSTRISTATSLAALTAATA